MSDADRHPAEVHAQEAAEAIRAFNHASFAIDSIDQPSTVYNILGELYTLASRLDQAIGQLSSPLQRQLEAGRLHVDDGAPFAGEPDRAVVTAVEELGVARECVHDAHEALTNAQSAISGLYAR
ncbi:MAG: hypothetical protein ABMA25_27505 [Ilumatobacteraceae bacterium]